MTPEKIIQIAIILLGVAAGAWGLWVDRERQEVKKQGVQTEAQRLLNIFAEESQKREKKLYERVEHLEGVVSTLQEQLDLFVGGSAYAVEGNRASFRG